MGNEYKVGNIVYLMSEKNFSIVPALIVEEVVRKTISNVDISYIIQLAGNKNKIDLSKVKEDIFTNIEEVREFMYENTKKSVDRMIDLAIQKEKVSFVDRNIDVSITESHVQKKENDVIINTVRQNDLQVTTNNIEEKWKYYF